MKINIEFNIDEPEVTLWEKYYATRGDSRWLFDCYCTYVALTQICTELIFAEIKYNCSIGRTQKFIMESCGVEDNQLFDFSIMSLKKYFDDVANSIRKNVYSFNDPEVIKKNYKMLDFSFLLKIIFESQKYYCENK